MAKVEGLYYEHTNLRLFGYVDYRELVSFKLDFSCNNQKSCLDCLTESWICKTKFYKSPKTEFMEKRLIDVFLYTRFG